MLVEFIILALAVPVGFLLAWLARDELVHGRKYFKVLGAASVVLLITFWFLDNRSVALSFGFIAIVSLISQMKSRDLRWIKGKI